MLQLPWYIVDFPVFDQLRTGLMIIEGYPALRALFMDGFYPGIIADPGTGSGFSADGHVSDDGTSIGCMVSLYIGPQVHGAEHGLNHHRVLRKRET